MDLRVIYLRDVLDVTSVTNVPGMVPRTLDVRGTDFRNVVRVEVNEYPAASFVIAGRTRLLVQVPEGQEAKKIRSIAVLSDIFTATKNSKLSFELSDNPTTTSGLMRMIQTFIMYLLRSPGTDAWYPNSGGGLQRFVGGNISKSNTGGLTADFTLAVNRTRSQVISLQASNVRLTPDERLAAANVQSAIFSQAQTALLARVELISQSGRRAAVGLEL